MQQMKAFPENLHVGTRQCVAQSDQSKTANLKGFRHHALILPLRCVHSDKMSHLRICKWCCERYRRKDHRVAASFTSRSYHGNRIPRNGRCIDTYRFSDQIQSSKLEHLTAILPTWKFLKLVSIPCMKYCSETEGGLEG